MRAVRHLHRHGSRRADIVEDDYSSDGETPTVVNRRGRILNRQFRAVAADKDAVEGKSHCFILLQGHLHGISPGLARPTVNESEHFQERSAYCFLALPPGYLLRSQIEICDVAGNVCAEDGITNRIESYQGAFLLQIQRILERFPLNRVVQCPRQGIAIQVIGQQIILCTAAYRIPRHGFLDISAQDKNWNAGNSREHLLESCNPMTIRKGQFEQDSRKSLFPQLLKTLRK